MKTKKENSKFLPKNDDGTDLRRLPLLRWSRDDGFGQTLPPRPAETPPRQPRTLPPESSLSKACTGRFQ